MNTNRRHRRNSNPGLAAALKKAGGDSQLGRLIGRAQPSVRRWRVEGVTVSAEDAVKIEHVTGVPAEAINGALAEFAQMRGLPVRPAKAA